MLCPHRMASSSSPRRSSPREDDTDPPIYVPPPPRRYVVGVRSPPDAPRWNSHTPPWSPPSHRSLPRAEALVTRRDPSTRRVAVTATTTTATTNEHGIGPDQVDDPRPSDMAASGVREHDETTTTGEPTNEERATDGTRAGEWSDLNSVANDPHNLPHGPRTGTPPPAAAAGNTTTTHSARRSKSPRPWSRRPVHWTTTRAAADTTTGHETRRAHVERPWSGVPHHDHHTDYDEVGIHRAHGPPSPTDVGNGDDPTDETTTTVPMPAAETKTSCVTQYPSTPSPAILQPSMTPTIIAHAVGDASMEYRPDPQRSLHSSRREAEGPWSQREKSTVDDVDGLILDPAKTPTAMNQKDAENFPVNQNDAETVPGATPKSRRMNWTTMIQTVLALVRETTTKDSGSRHGPRIHRPYHGGEIPPPPPSSLRSSLRRESSWTTIAMTIPEAAGNYHVDFTSPGFSSCSASAMDLPTLISTTSTQSTHLTNNTTAPAWIRGPSPLSTHTETYEPSCSRAAPTTSLTTTDSGRLSLRTLEWLFSENDQDDTGNRNMNGVHQWSPLTMLDNGTSTAQQRIHYQRFLFLVLNDVISYSASDGQAMQLAVVDQIFTIICTFLEHHLQSYQETIAPSMDLLSMYGIACQILRNLLLQHAIQIEDLCLSRIIPVVSKVLMNYGHASLRSQRNTVVDASIIVLIHTLRDFTRNRQVVKNLTSGTKSLIFLETDRWQRCVATETTITGAVQEIVSNLLSPLLDDVISIVPLPPDCQYSGADCDAVQITQRAVDVLESPAYGVAARLHSCVILGLFYRKIPFDWTPRQRFRLHMSTSYTICVSFNVESELRAILDLMENYEYSICIQEMCLDTLAAYFRPIHHRLSVEMQTELHKSLTCRLLNRLLGYLVRFNSNIGIQCTGLHLLSLVVDIGDRDVIVCSCHNIVNICMKILPVDGLHTNILCRNESCRILAALWCNCPDSRQSIANADTIDFINDLFESTNLPVAKCAITLAWNIIQTHFSLLHGNARSSYSASSLVSRLFECCRLHYGSSVINEVCLLFLNAIVCTSLNLITVAAPEEKIRLLCNYIRNPTSKSLVTEQACILLIGIIPVVPDAVLWKICYSLSDDVVHAIQSKEAAHQDLQSLLLDLVHRLCLRESCYQVLLVNTVPHLSMLVQSQIENERIQITCFSTLRLLVSSSTEASNLCNIEAVNGLISSMMCHSTNANMIIDGLVIIMILVKRNKSTREYLLETNLQDFVVGLMQLNMLNANLMGVALATLNNVTVDVQHRSISQMTSDTMETTIAAMEEHPDDPTVQKNGILFLKSCTYEQQNLKVMQANSACIIPVLAAATGKFTNVCGARALYVMKKLLVK